MPGTPAYLAMPRSAQSLFGSFLLGDISTAPGTYDLPIRPLGFQSGSKPPLDFMMCNMPAAVKFITISDGFPTVNE